MAEPRYGYIRRLEGSTMDEARSRVVDALKQEGFGVLTEIDVEHTLREKLGTEFRPYRILGACNPQLASQALTADPAVGLLLPCNVCLWQEDNGVTVAIARPETLFEVAASTDVEPVMREARDRIARVAAALS